MCISTVNHAIRKYWPINRCKKKESESIRKEIAWRSAEPGWIWTSLREGILTISRAIRALVCKIKRIQSWSKWITRACRVRWGGSKLRSWIWRGRSQRSSRRRSSSGGSTTISAAPSSSATTTTCTASSPRVQCCESIGKLSTRPSKNNWANYSNRNSNKIVWPKVANCLRGLAKISIFMHRYNWWRSWRSSPKKYRRNSQPMKRIRFCWRIKDAKSRRACRRARMPPCLLLELAMEIRTARLSITSICRRLKSCLESRPREAKTDIWELSTIPKRTSSSNCQKKEWTWLRSTETRSSRQSRGSGTSRSKTVTWRCWNWTIRSAWRRLARKVQ